MNKQSLLFIFSLTLALFLINQWFAPSRSAAPAAAVATATVAQAPSAENFSENRDTPIDSDEKFYVIENAYQQLVFSNVGGALTEINLPFKSETHPDSVIQPVGFDTSMQKQCPYNDHFPSSPYYKATGSGSIEKVSPSSTGGYYPLLRRDIFNTQKEIVYKVDPKFYALTLLADTGRKTPEVYKMRRLEKNLIEFEGRVNGKSVIKTFSLPVDPQKEPYCFHLSVQTQGDTRGISLTSGIPEVEIVSGSASPSIKYFLRKNKKPVVEKLSLPKTSNTVTSAAPEWVSNSNGFLGVIIHSLNGNNPSFTASQVPGELSPTKISVLDAEYDLYPRKKYPGYQLSVPLQSERAEYRIYAGPYEDDIFKLLDKTFTVDKVSPRYISALSFQGWFTFISEPFAKFLFILMKFFYFITRSWGVSIILLTAALRVMLYPLNAWSIKATSKMQKISPEVQKIQEKYKKDPKRSQLEVVALYREKGVNPFSGCLPMLIQLPFLIGMFDLLKSTFELRGAVFIPGWISNLTAPDVVFSWKYPLPFFGTSFHLLPILLGAVMYYQQKMSAPKIAPNRPLTDQQKQQKMMGNIMTIVFTVMFYHFPSGLNLYWLSSMLLGIAQQWWMMKRLNKEPTIEIMK